jgi:hypothetical protein
MNVKPKHPHAPGSRAARREANAAKRASEAVARQAEAVALRVSMALTWIVIVTFRGGAHDVRLHNVSAPLPEGYSEARVSLRERGNLPALRYTIAERLAERLRAALDRNRVERGETARRAVSPTVLLRRRA